MTNANLKRKIYSGVAAPEDAHPLMRSAAAARVELGAEGAGGVPAAGATALRNAGL